MINNYDYIVAHPESFKTLSVKKMLFAHYLCPQVDRLAKLWTNYNLITYTLSGRKTFHHSGKSWTLTDHSSLFLRKTGFIQEKYEYAGWEVLAFYLQDDFLRRVFEEYRQYLPLKDLPPCPTDMLIEIQVSETTRAFFHSVIPYFNRSIAPPEDLLEMKFKELLFNILTDPLNKNLLAYINSINDQYKIPVWQVMEANYMFNLNISDFARMAQRSITSFKREFYEQYNITPGRWLTGKRLEHGKLLLDTSSKTISEIADESGFENLSHFSRIFKEKHGASPIQYRKKSRSNC
ncbi:MAG: AraC family transcriptional regulator [Cyclobacteriaceae bacterium]